MAGLSPKLPLARSPEDGHWGLNKTFLETTKQNLKNLILTNPGERIMIPLFGVGLLTFLFSQQGEFVEEQIKAKIIEQTSIYLPHIKFIDIEASNSFHNLEISPHVLVIRIIYRVIPLNQDDILNIIVDPDKQAVAEAAPLL